VAVEVVWPCGRSSDSTTSSNSLPLAPGGSAGCSAANRCRRSGSHHARQVRAVSLPPPTEHRDRYRWRALRRPPARDRSVARTRRPARAARRAARRSELALRRPISTRSRPPAAATSPIASVPAPPDRPRPGGRSLRPSHRQQPRAWRLTPEWPSHPRIASGTPDLVGASGAAASGSQAIIEASPAPSRTPRKRRAPSTPAVAHPTSTSAVSPIDLHRIEITEVVSTPPSTSGHAKGGSDRTSRS